MSSHVCRILVLLGMLVWALPSPAEPAEGSGTQRIWLESTTDFLSGRVAINLDLPDAYLPDASISFDCQVQSEESLELCHIVFEVLDASKNVIYTEDKEILLHPGANPFPFVWDPVGAAAGVYTAHFKIVHEFGGTISWRKALIRKLAYDDIQNNIDQAKETVRSMRAHLEGLAAKPALADVRIAVAEAFLPEAQEAFDSGDWRRADSLAAYVENTVQSVRASMAFSGSGSRAVSTYPNTNLAHLEYRSGRIESGGRPVYLVGLTGGGWLAEEMARLRRFNLGLAVYTPGLGREDEASQVFASAQKQNISVALNIANADGQVDEALAGGQNTAETAAHSAQIRAMLADAAKQPMLNSFVLGSKLGNVLSVEKARADFISAIVPAIWRCACHKRDVAF